MDLESAIRKHAEWKTKFRSAILGRQTMDAAAIARDDRCELGRWLHADAKARHRHLACLQQCIDHHATFHVEAGKVADAINARRYAEAEAMLGAGTGYTNASMSVGSAIIRLKKEAGL